MNCLVNKIKTKQGRKHNGSIQRPRIFYFSKKSPLRSLQSFPHRLFHSFLCFTKSVKFANTDLQFHVCLHTSILPELAFGHVVFLSSAGL